MASPGRQEEVIDKVKNDKKINVRRSCGVLGFRRQTYYRRQQGHCPEELDQVIAELLHQTTRLDSISFSASPGASLWLALGLFGGRQMEQAHIEFHAHDHINAMALSMHKQFINGKRAVAGQVDWPV